MNTHFSSNQDIINELSSRLKKQRIARGLSQEAISQRTGLSIHTISNIENGKSFTLENLIKVMRALDILDRFDLLIEEPQLDPYLIFKDKSEKQRVKTSKKSSGTWKWGDEQ